VPLLGLALVGGSLRIVDGVIEAHGPWLRRLFFRYATFEGVSAITLGHIVVGRDQAALDATREHERVHVRQCERWGPLFLPAYALASVYAVMAGGHYYRDNVFEREAFNA
jgi:hypothetical protein